MANKIVAEYRAKDVSALQELLASLSREYFILKMKKNQEEFKKVSEFKRVRRNISRVLTILGEKNK